MNTDDQLKAALKRDAALREAIKLDEIEAPKMPSDLNARLMQRVAQEQAPVATRTRRLWPWIAAACAVAFIAVFLTPPKGVVTELVAKAITTESAENAETTESPAPEAAPEAAPAPVAVPAVKVAAKAPKAAPAAPKTAPAAPKAAAPAGGKTITSPLPGVIIEVSVKEGQAVKKGQKIAVLEAMKMENEILAEFDGTVTEIFIKKGDSVLEGANVVTLA